MPELPEVETIRKELQGRIVGQTVQACTVLRKDVIACPPSRTFCTEIKGERILSVGRRAKYLIIQLTHDKQLIVHLRLSGSISIV
ncbi:MAG: formamidopyrimidine-DNA glycosylase, partial [candidate division WOR-3 bacterium]